MAKFKLNGDLGFKGVEGFAKASFEVESAILKEIGEQLVGSSETAVTELVKNAFDADATEVAIKWDDSVIILTDNGHGMTEDDFLNRWMKVGTSNKIIKKTSRIYKRKLSGSKGVGRFAVRFLGDVLEFTSVAANGNKRSKITATFNWKEIDELEELEEVRVDYNFESNVDDPIGTTLQISDLKNNDDFEANIDNVKNNLLDLETPISPIIKDLGIDLVRQNDTDPGFNFIDLNSQAEKFKKGAGEDQVDVSMSTASQVLGAYVARAVIKYTASDGVLSVSFSHKTKSKNQTFKKKVFDIPGLTTDVIADIRFLPRRDGVFKGLEGINGTKAYGWVKEHRGIRVFDRGFRIPPYGLENNDWLFQDYDQASSRRHWRSHLMEKYFPMSDDVRTLPKLNYMLNLPKTTQVIGAVFVETDPRRNAVGLTSNMDRRGFKGNEAYKQLVEIIRFALEYLAMLDKKITIEKEEKEQDAINESTRTDIKEAIRLIKKTTGLTPEHKSKIVEQYQYLSQNIDDLERYDRESREALETMSLMGVIAGFMTHEYQSAIGHLEDASDLLGSLSNMDGRFVPFKEGIDKNMRYFVDYIEYTRAFVTSLNSAKDPKFKALARVLHVTRTFSGYCEDNDIEVITSDLPKDMDGPQVPLALYQGIIQNLFTNAIKALISQNSDKRKVKVIAWNEGAIGKRRHIIQVMDNGPGIASALRNRIWDPLFTTTSNENNPLGSGMGLGLSLLKKVIKQQKGVIDLVEPPEGFNTCFRVELPFERN